MKIVIVTQDEPFYIPILMKRFTDTVSDPVEIFLLSGVPFGFNQVTYYKRLFDLFGLTACLRFGSLLLQGVFRELVYHDNSSFSAVARKKNIPLMKADKINDPRIVEKIRLFHPDMIISIASPQIFRQELISSADHVLNIHAALLPQYRGMMPNFWVLAKGEARTGITVHYVDANIDTGPIVLQREIIIGSEETFHSLNTKVAETSADMLIEVVQNIASGSITTKMPEGEGSYFSFPTKDAAKEFRARGRRII